VKPWLVVAFAAGFFLSAGCSAGREAQAQTHTNNPAPPANAASVQLGHSVAALYGPWRFTVGDSPVDPRTGGPLWAEPDFDDSRWETVDLSGQTQSIDPIIGTPDYVPGWTAKGHPGYWGYAWYRIRVQIDSRPDLGLAIAGPSDVDDVYQFFDNGTLRGTFGDFAPGHPPTVYTTRPVMFHLPQRQGDGRTQVFAFRVYMMPNTLTQLDDVGGFHNAPLLGEVGAITSRYQVQWEELYRAYASELIEAIVFAILALVAVSLRLFDRSDPIYLWIGAVMLGQAAVGAMVGLGAWTEAISGLTTNVLRHVFLNPLLLAGWVMLWRSWFQLRRGRWILWALPGLVAALMVSIALGDNLFFFILSQNVSAPFHTLSLVLRLALWVLLLVTVGEGIREQGLEGWLALPAALLEGIGAFGGELIYLHVHEIWFPLGLQFQVADVANLLLVATLAVLLLRRLALSIKRQRLMALDVKQAQEVQQVILPQARTVLPGFAIESEYRPALDVGGDFFQIIPNPADGSLLVVAGDVTGKGLQAGMMVALLVGAIRTVVGFSDDPVVMLRELNHRLMGRGDARATCLALRIAADGSATLANAGHLPPYLNGQLMDVEGSLPLGVLDDPEFTLLRFTLAANDRLTLLSDGIAEATDAEGRLFGFDRVLEMLRQSLSAEEIAMAAQRFGQEDDISVILVTRTAVLEPAVA
jgi:hypothetical protein